MGRRSGGWSHLHANYAAAVRTAARACSFRAVRTGPISLNTDESSSKISSSLSTISFSRICVPAVEICCCTFPISFWIVRYVFSSVSRPFDIFAAAAADADGVRKSRDAVRKGETGQDELGGMRDGHGGEGYRLRRGTPRVYARPSPLRAHRTEGTGAAEHSTPCADANNALGMPAVGERGARREQHRERVVGQVGINETLGHQS
jgi:hypothetical protein